MSVEKHLTISEFSRTKCEYSQASSISSVGEMYMLSLLLSMCAEALLKRSLKLKEPRMKLPLALVP